MAKTVEEAVKALDRACVRMREILDISASPARIYIELCSAHDGYLTSDTVSFRYDNITKRWGGRYSDTCFNFETAFTHGWFHCYRGHPLLKKEKELATRALDLVNRYGYQAVKDASAGNERFLAW